MSRSNAIAKVPSYNCHPIDRASARIMAFLHQVEPFAGHCADDAFESGRHLVERMANSGAGGDAHSLRLSIEQCADVIAFVSEVEPRDPKRFFNWMRYGVDRNGVDLPDPAMGLFEVLMHVQDELRRLAAHGERPRGQRRHAACERRR